MGYEPDFSSVDRDEALRSLWMRVLESRGGMMEEGIGVRIVSVQLARDTIPWELMLINARRYGHCPSSIRRSIRNGSGELEVFRSQIFGLTGLGFTGCRAGS
jgi:hypothetical protein